MFTIARRIQLENTRIARTPGYSVEGKHLFCFRRTAIFLVWSKDCGRRLAERKNNDNFPETHGTLLFSRHDFITFRVSSREKLPSRSLLSVLW